MTERLFVYGSLAPGRPNAHLLASIGGIWNEATVTGTLRAEGWGAALGYPGLLLDEHGEDVRGFLLTAERLSGHWAALDAFEGEAYARVRTTVTLGDGTQVDAHVYVLRAMT